jgi:hypothetical protein
LKKKLLIASALSSTLAFGQNTHGLDSDGFSDSDSTHIENVKEFFSRGHVSGHVRYYFMSTYTPGELTDYYANAAGGTIRYQTAKWKGIKLGLGGNFIYNIGSSDLEQHDPLSGRSSRFEKQLFDVTDPGNKYDLDRLEELFINYSNSWVSITLGKHALYTPLVNPQDGRMKPYLVEGLWADIRPSDHWVLHAGYITKMSPRSTVSWYRLEDAMGLYGPGVNPDGTPSDYKDNISTRGMAIAGFAYDKKNLSVQFWNYYLDNILNAAFTQVEYKYKTWFSGVQYLREDALHSGGSEQSEESYYPVNQTTNMVSFRLGKRIKNFTLSANFTHIFDSGRFLFPREFGREQFYTTIGRGRVEGMGDGQTVMLKGVWVPARHPELSIEIDAGRTFTPGEANTELNKYILDSYDQYNLDVKYRFQGIWQGLTIRFLYVHNRLLEGGYSAPELIHNRHNYHHFNLITNIYF